MALTVNIPGTATATIDDRNNISISLLVEIKNEEAIVDSKTITINVYLHTANVLDYAVSMMVAEIAQYKASVQKTLNIQTALANFTNQVKAAV